ncbi:hypothetical protein JX265_005846 [Neoarthrinium moseri]|uniref:Uncharacterized protein n=1 Tax=Neoarthrinium moseri TaxID=1658444 RepID=A0A9Q0AQB0_9PEZI|nr:uncharacterized protein JN550_011616 [Neoarthrinium moseri]KAI1860238.1 hypothetical protein JN550_011616 [Neoarthrinium moseri]KAI1871860.1 hypothetical protein JX265_005846 [Neoarthrinium moseri]
MHNDRTHPLLAQVPLTVSPFVSLPTAATLPYTYKAMPSTLPPSSTGITGTSNSSSAGGDDPSAKPRYVVSASGHAAHPDDIVASCRALQGHVAKMQEDAERELRELDDRIRARELAEKRRVAPGWLDSEARLLEPERRAAGGELDDENSAAYAGEFSAAAGTGVAGQFAEMSIADREGASEMAVDHGAELDRAFGAR